MGSHLPQGFTRVLLIAATIASSMMLGQDRDHDRSVELDRQGETQLAQGNLAGAHTSFQHSLDILRRLAAGDANSIKAQLEMVVCLTKLGAVQVKQTDLTAARGTYQEHLTLTRHLVASDPGSTNWQQLLAISLFQLGDVQLEKGEHVAAGASFQEGLDISRSLAVASPGSAVLQFKVSEGLAKLGDLYLVQGDRAKASATIQECLEIQLRLADADPNAANVHRDLVINLARMSDITGDPLYPLKALEVVLAMKKHGILAPEDTWMIDDLRKRTETPAYLVTLAEAYYVHDDYDDAALTAKKALTLQPDVATKRLLEANLRKYEAAYKVHLAAVLETKGDQKGAIAEYEAALQLDSKNVNALTSLSSYAGLHDPAKALEYALRAVALDDDAFDLETLADAYYVNRDYRNAVLTAKKALGRDPFAPLKERIEGKLHKYEQAAQAVVTIPIQGAAQAPVHGEQAAFNKLTYLIVDEDHRGIRLFGINDPEGPREPIPYAQLLAEALRLPDEKGNPGAIDSVPGFSLVPNAAFLKSYAILTEKFPYQQDLVAAVRTYLGENPEADTTFVESAIGQSLTAVRATLKQFLYARIEHPEADNFVDRIKSADDLMATVRLLQRNGTVKESDESELSRRIELSILEFQTKEGNLLFFPKGTIEAILGQPLYSDPVFFGVDGHTQIARIAFESDLALKSLAGAPGYKLKARFPFHQTSLEWGLKNRAIPDEKHPVTWGALFVRPKNITLETSADKQVVSFGKAEMSIQIGSLDGLHFLPNTIVAYGDFLSAHYDDYAQEIAPLWELRELSKVIAAVRYLKERGLKMQLRPEESWIAPQRVQGQWDSASVGRGGSHYVVYFKMFGGVGLQVKAETQISGLADLQTNRIKLAGAQLDAVLQSGATGLCYDGQVGCSRDKSLGTARIEGRPRGIDSLPPKLLSKWGQTPEGKELIESEKSLRTQQDQASAKVAEIKKKREATTDPAVRSRLDVEYSEADIAKNRVDQQLYMKQVKVEQKAKDVVLE